MAENIVEKRETNTKFCKCLKKELSNIMFSVNSDRLIFYKCLILAVLIFCSFFCSVFAYIALCFALLFTITETKIKAIYYLVFLLPFYNVFRYTTKQMYFSVWILIAFVVVTAIKLVCDLFAKKKKLNWIVTILYLVVGIYLCLPIGPFSVSKLLPIVSVLCVTYLLFYYFDEINFKTLTLFLFYGIIIGALFSLFINVFPRLSGFVVRFNSYNLTHFRFQGLSRDPNYYALEILLCMTCFTCLYFHKKINWLYYPIFIILSCLGVLTGSKSFLIVYALFSSILVVILLIKLFIKKKLGKYKERILTMVVLIISIILPFGICYKSTSFLIDRIVNPSFSSVIDFGGQNNNEHNSGSVGSLDDVGDNTSGDTSMSENESKLNGLTTGRSQIWKYYLKDYTSSPKKILFGVGVGSGYRGGDNEVAIHNTVIQCLYFLGLIGCLLILALVLVYIWQLKGFKSIKTINLIVPCFIVLIMMCSLDNLFSYRLYILVIMLLYSIFETDRIICDNLNIADNGKKLAKDKDAGVALSIIVPVYNINKYIEKCAESILNNLKNIDYELIFVDDGSTDGSEEILDNLKTKYPDIIVKHKSNGGVSSARNLGIEISSGKYLMFIDGDDIVDKNISKIVDYLKEENDLVVFNHTIDREGKTALIRTVKNEVTFLKTNNEFNDFVANDIKNSPWGKLFKRSIVVDNNLKFEQYSIAEDMLFVSMYLQYVNLIKLSTISYYHYLVRQGSAMTSVKLQKVKDQIDACKRAIDFCNGSAISKELKESIRQFVTRTSFSTYKLYCKATTQADKEEIYKLLCENKELLKETSSLKTKLLKFGTCVLGLRNTLKLVDLIF